MILVKLPKETRKEEKDMEGRQKGDLGKYRIEKR